MRLHSLRGWLLNGMESEAFSKCFFFFLHLGLTKRKFNSYRWSISKCLGLGLFDRFDQDDQLHRSEHH